MIACLNSVKHIVHFWQRKNLQSQPALGAMPGKSVWQPKGSMPDRRWLQATAERLDAVRSGLAQSAAQEESQGVESRDVEPSAASSSSAGPSYGDPMQSGVQPRGQPQNPQEELAALRLGRTAPSTFNLQRHAVMVRGRPVVAPMQHKTLNE